MENDILKYFKDNKLRVKVKTNFKKNEILGFDEAKKQLRISISKQPIEGKVNKELIKFLSKKLRKKIEIIQGENSTDKTVKFK